ncbi:MAG TPA: PilZ domain-containing protein [Candidatus Eisenbacteria bacterium]|nr:PilZ domain-containing protein [Candidatus Eisenbacteria bacterium]
MQSTSVPVELVAALSSRAGERRKNPRFDMHVPVYLRPLGEPWISTETADVSAAGAFFVTARPLLLNAPIEYVLTFPPELTKAKRPLLVRFFGMVSRCERFPEGHGLYGVAVRNSTYRYLTREEAAHFDAMGKKPSPAESPELQPPCLSGT